MSDREDDDVKMKREHCNKSRVLAPRPAPPTFTAGMAKGFQYRHETQWQIITSMCSDYVEDRYSLRISATPIYKAGRKLKLLLPAPKRHLGSELGAPERNDKR